MRFFDFIDIHFQNRSYENAQKYSIKTDGELQSLHGLVALQRRFFRLTGYVRIVFLYFLLRVGLTKPPINKVPKPTPTQKPKLEAVPNEPVPA